MKPACVLVCSSGTMLTSIPSEAAVREFEPRFIAALRLAGCKDVHPIGNFNISATMPGWEKPTAYNLHTHCANLAYLSDEELAQEVTVQVCK